MRHLTVEGLTDFLDGHPHAKVLDIRSAHERREGHIQGDHHVPWYSPDWTPDPAFLDQALQCVSPKDHVMVICRSGQLSYKAAALLEAAGFHHVYNVLGGYQDLLAPALLNHDAAQAGTAR